jgi:hypothetical protein
MGVSEKVLTVGIKIQAVRHLAVTSISIFISGLK